MHRDLRSRARRRVALAMLVLVVLGPCKAGWPGARVEPDGRLRVDCDRAEILCDDEEA